MHERAMEHKAFTFVPVRLDDTKPLLYRTLGEPSTSLTIPTARMGVACSTFSTLSSPSPYPPPRRASRTSTTKNSVTRKLRSMPQ